MKKPSKRLREEAAMICAIAASNDWTGLVENPGGEPRPRESGDAAVVLAWEAFDVAVDAWYGHPDAEWHGSDRWAEAEAMLRSGEWP